MWGDLGKLIVAKGFKNLIKVQYIAQSGHTELPGPLFVYFCYYQTQILHKQLKASAGFELGSLY